MDHSTQTIKKLPPQKDIFSDHLVDTYFYQKKSEKKPAPQIKHKKAAPLLIIIPLVIAFIAAFIAAAFYANNFYKRSASRRLAKATAITITKGGAIERDVVQKAEFHGYAKGKGSITKDQIVLKNINKYKWSDLSLDFRVPLDFSGKHLSMALKSKVGGEKISLVMRDSHNRSVRLRDIFVTSNWRTETIPLSTIKRDIDLSNITHMRFECDYVGEPAKGAGIAAEVTIYIKDVTIKKEAR
ncbi:MAG: hypothetical protein JW919_06960 [Candidatus Omnitrophica bacterium]|nr:hypothetical protein [Candidatus Omnitrophota bacterium]